MKLRRDLWASLAILGFLALLPAWVSSQYWRSTFVVAMYQALLAIGWNLLAGYTGQFSFATAAFAMIGAYASGLLGPEGVPVALRLSASVVVPALLGLAIGWASLRLSGAYLSLTTIAFAGLVQLVAYNEYQWTRGDLGLHLPAILGGSQLTQYYLFVALVAAVQVGMYVLVRSPVGLFLQAIRDEELGAQARGVNVVRWKLFAFVASSALAGLAGALYAHYIRLAVPEMGTIHQMGLVIAMVVIGGMGTLTGPLLGAVLVEGISEYFTDFGAYHRVLFALLVILFARFFRQGLYGLVEGRFRRVERTAALGARAEQELRRASGAL